MTDLRQLIHWSLFFLAAVMLLAGCESEVQPENGGGQKDNLELVEREFNAYIDNGTGTRTEIGNLNGDRYPVVWSKGDKIKVFPYNSNNVTECTLISGENSNKGVFQGRLWEGAQHYSSVYPSGGASCEVKSKKINDKYYHDEPEGTCFVRRVTIGILLPSTQSYQKGTFANNVFPMAGVCYNQYDFNYENLGGILQLPVTGNGTISRIILTGNDEELIAGYFNVEYDYHWINSAQKLKIDNLESEIPEEEREATDRKITVTNGKEAVIVDCGEDGLKLDPVTPTMVNIVILPKTFRKGFTVRFIDKDNSGSFTKTTSKPITVKRSYVKTMEAFDYQKPEPLETANCYVVDKAGYFLMPAFCMGNRPKSGRLDVDQNGKNNKTGNPVVADYLWTDIPGAISDIEYLPGKDGYISFKVNPDADGNAPRGNTVIALYDSVTKEILWSWHVWMSDFKEVVTDGECRAGESTTDGFTSDASKKRLTIMDRNLGAISAKKEDGWKTYGLYYQMGRKDPFIGANGSGGDKADSYKNKDHYDNNIPSYIRYEEKPFGSMTNATEWNSNITKGWNYVNNYITAIHGYQNPMDYASWWAKKDDARWTTKEVNTTAPFKSEGGHEDFWNRSKTINDPCPSGWTVLGENGKLSNWSTNLKFYHGEEGAYGLEESFTTSSGAASETVWWPAAGFRSVDGTLGNLGYGGYYWWFDHIEASHGGHGQWFTFDGKTSKTTSGVMTNHACSIRCVKARQ